MSERVGRITIVGMVVVAAVAGSSASVKAAGREAMQACATRVMSQLSKSNAPAERVGPTVVARCDRQLRQALTDAIRTGEAGGCTVESCIQMARERASDESTQQYRARGGQ